MFLLNSSESAEQKNSLKAYSPHRGYIGNLELEVPNYLFASPTPESSITEGGPSFSAYRHCRRIVSYLVSRPIQTQYAQSQELTQFLRRRELTFSKKTKSGEHRIFTVPCTTTPVPIAKSTFNEIERSSQVLVAALRLVMQDIYGSDSVRNSTFVNSLPRDVKKSFLDAVERSPHYFPQLHHPVMKSYPFFDVVGLDLVLTENYADTESRGPRLVNKASPFRLLEINAGSPSGASNNLTILEGLSQIDPEGLRALGKVMPNDHFEVLGQAYRTLGESWTQRTDGVQVVLPPGGENGATPEIHQLAAKSGLIYCDAGQLYRAADGYIRMRTVSGKDPVVTAIYSRVNSDSALFNAERKLTLRDAETGKPLYVPDPLESSFRKNAKPLRTSDGDPIPLESSYAVPGAIEAIHSKKLYMGGLNRILDNKIILDALCRFAPLHFRSSLLNRGLDPDTVTPILPPETLPSTPESIAIIEKSPEDWVIKTPNLSGGSGVYILQTLSPSERLRIIALAKANPRTFAYQKLVRIARIPVAQQRGEEFRLSNIAADVRMWMFFGEGKEFTLPRLTHNALIRTAPYEKGPMSSTVNTSKGGGYAPMVVIDDIGHPDSISAERAIENQHEVNLKCDLPSFVGAQLIQLSEMVSHLREQLGRSDAETYQTWTAVQNLKRQSREVLSFLHGRNMEPINQMIELLEKKVAKTPPESFEERRNRRRLVVSACLIELEPNLNGSFFHRLDDLRVLNSDAAAAGAYSDSDRKRDLSVLDDLKQMLNQAQLDRTTPARRLMLMLGQLVRAHFPARPLTEAACRSLLFRLEKFSLLAHEHLDKSVHGRKFSGLFSTDACVAPTFDILFADDSNATTRAKNESAWIATEEEVRTGKLITETDLVAPELRAARASWLKKLAEAENLPQDYQASFLKTAREAHFREFPVLQQYQKLINAPATQESANPELVIKMLEILPYAKYNMRQFSRMQGVTISDLFENTLSDRRISFLSVDERKNVGLDSSSFAGECFARKRSQHGLFSDSQIFLWVASELHPMVQAYTMGHELVHFHQINAMMERERGAVSAGPVPFAGFLNFYGNFLGHSSGTLENQGAAALLQEWKAVYGLTEAVEASKGAKTWVHELRSSLPSGPDAWNATVMKFGSSIGYSLDACNQDKIRAIREVIPALENAKNIRFMKELGLDVSLDETRSALPNANSHQVARYRAVVERAITNPSLDWEALRVIANHQYPGIRFERQPSPNDNLKLRAALKPIALAGSYNQTQQ